MHCLVKSVKFTLCRVRFLVEEIFKTTVDVGSPLEISQEWAEVVDMFAVNDVHLLLLQKAWLRM